MAPGLAPDARADQDVIVSFVHKGEKAFGADSDFVFTSLDSCKYSSVQAILADTGFKWGRQLWHTSDACLTNIYWLVFSDQDDVAKICSDLQDDSEVEYAVESGTVEPLADPYVVEPNDYWYNHSRIKQRSATHGSASPQKTSWGVRHPRLRRGRWFRRSWTHSICHGSTSRKFSPLGKYCRTSPLTCSFSPRSHA